MWMAFTLSEREVTPSPPRICSLSTTRIPSRSRSTVLGATAAPTCNPSPSVPPVPTFTSVVEPVAVRAEPHVPPMTALDLTSSAWRVSRGATGTSEIPRSCTVAFDET